MNQFTYKKLLSPFPVLLATAALLFAAVFYRSITAMAAHGFTWHFLIFPLFLYLIFDRKKELNPQPETISFIFGLLLMLFSFLLLFAGNVSATLVLAEIAIIFGIWGGVLILGGFKTFLFLFWPLVYLFFISSALDTLFDMLSPITRLSTANIAAFLAGIIGFPVSLSDTYIRLPNMVLNVADECSGINHLISLIAIAFPMGYILRLKPVAFSFFMVMTFPVAIISNALRVFMIILFNFNRTEFTHGPKNLLVTGSGFFIGLLILSLIGWLLARYTKPSPQRQPSGTGIGKLPQSPVLLYPVGFTIVLLCGLIFLVSWRVKEPVMASDLHFTQTNASITIKPCTSIPGLAKLPAADYEYRYVCTSASEPPVYLYIGTYKKQSIEREVAGYLYDDVLSNYSNPNIPSALKTRNGFRICRSEDPATGLIYLVTYISYSSITSRPETTKIHAFVNALLHRTTSAAIVIFAVPAANNADVTEALKTVDTVAPVVRKAVIFQQTRSGKK